MSWVRFLLLLVLLLLAISFPLAKQLAQLQSGSIEGYILDDQGAPVPEATIEARDTLRGRVSQAGVNTSGYYKIPNLVPGKYSLWAQANGYSCEWVPMVIVEQRKNVRQDFRLVCEKAPPISAYIR